MADPNAVVKGPTWEDDQDVGGGRKGFCGTTTYADGRKQRICYEYGSNAEVNREQLNPDPEIKKDWDEKQKTAHTSATGSRYGTDPATGRTVKITTYEDGHTTTEEVSPSQQGQTGATTSTSYSWVQTPSGGKRLHIITKDQNGRVISDDEASPQQQQEYEQFERGGKKTYGTAYKNAQGKWVRPWTDPSGGQGVEELPPEAVPQDKAYTEIKQDPQTGKWWGLKADGTWELTSGGGPSKPPVHNVQRDPNTGQLVDVTTDENGNPVVKPVAGQNAAEGAEPPGAPPADFSPGGITKNLSDYQSWLMDQIRAGKVTKQQAVDLFNARKSLLDTASKENSAEEQRAASTYSAQLNQRQQDIGLAESRMTAAGNQFNTAQTGALTLNKSLPSGSTGGAAAMLGSLAGQMALAHAYGGDATPASIPLPAYMQRTAGQAAAPAQAAPVAQQPAFTPAQAANAAATPLPAPGTQGPAGLAGGPSATPLAGPDAGAPPDAGPTTDPTTSAVPPWLTNAYQQAAMPRFAQTEDLLRGLGFSDNELMQARQRVLGGAAA